jgi:hypothetical protein
MAPTYNQIAVMLKRPVNGRRRAPHNYTYYQYAEDKKTIEYVVDWGRGATMLATISPDNVLTVQLGENAKYIWARSRIERLTHKRIFSDTRRHKNKEQTIRVVNNWSEYKQSKPYFDGLQVQLGAWDNKFLNLELAKDKVRRLDKTKGAEVRRQIAPLIKLFKVSMKIGAMDEHISKAQTISRYHKDVDFSLDELVKAAHDPNMAHVQALYWHGVKRTSLAWWGDVTQEIRTRVPENAARALREHAYKMHNAYNMIETE